MAAAIASFVQLYLLPNMSKRPDFLLAPRTPIQATNSFPSKILVMASRFRVAPLVVSPVYPNAVAWSDENLVAITSAEIVTIMLPKNIDKRILEYLREVSYERWSCL